MRDALGALGPVDGINPELSNLTISVTTLQKGDIVMVATDGLTDNFDPNVCKFSVNTVEIIKPKLSIHKSPQKRNVTGQRVVAENKLVAQKNVQKPPIKPPRRSKNREYSGGSSVDRSSVKSSSLSEKSSSPSVENERVNVSSEPTNTLDSSNEPGEEDSGLDKPLEKSVLSHSTNSHKTEDRSSMESDLKSTVDTESVPDKNDVDLNNPLVAQFMRENSLDETVKTIDSKLLQY